MIHLTSKSLYMENHDQSKPAVNDVHTNTPPSVTETGNLQPAINSVDENQEPLTDEHNPGKTNKDKQQTQNHHTSAMYAGSMWRNTVGHVRPYHTPITQH